MVKISIVIPTYNSADFILPCLNSILRQQATETEIILVDNGSKDNTVSLARNYPQIMIIENKVNLGASCARNQGIAVASGEWILALDCDVILEGDFFKKALENIAVVSAKTGLIQPKILNLKQNKIYSAGIKKSFLARFHDLGKGSPDTKKFNVSGNIFGACSAAAFYRRKMLEQIKDKYGYFDERFFFLFEDADLSWRAQKNGWFCFYVPNLKCSHYANSSATAADTRQLLSFLNRQRMILKNQNLLITLLMLPFYLVYDFPRFLILAFKFKCKFPEFKAR